MITHNFCRLRAATLKMRANVSEMERHSMLLWMIAKSGETFFIHEFELVE